MMANNQTGKARKAHNRLDAINEEIKKINTQLENARQTLRVLSRMTVSKQDFSKIEGIDEKISEEIWEWLNKEDLINENGKVSLAKVGPDKKDCMLNNLKPEYGGIAVKRYLRVSS